MSTKAGHSTLQQSVTRETLTEDGGLKCRAQRDPGHGATPKVGLHLLDETTADQRPVSIIEKCSPSRKMTHVLLISPLTLMSKFSPSTLPNAATLSNVTGFSRL